jgi:predicted ATPase/class 3 adenylate cyclase/Tfp pilus assembly protein PilF
MSAASIDVLGERREVTVLFLDIVNFTAAAHSLDSEDIYLLTNDAMRLLAEVIYNFEGAIDKFTGDGLMALFGVPLAHENDPERAVRAALDMQSALEPLQRRILSTHAFRLQTRIGINTGQVIAGNVGSDRHLEYTVIGDTVNLADRLQTAAEPDTILVSFETYQRTRPLFRFDTVPPFMAKGMPYPIRAFRPVELLDKPGRIRGLPGLQTPMIGRQDALEQLQHSLERVRASGQRQIALVTGEAGLGKSRLVTEFRATLTSDTISVFEGGCLAYARSRPLWLVSTLLRNMIRLSDADPVPVQTEALHAYLDRLDIAQDDVEPVLVHLLGLPQANPSLKRQLELWDANMLQQQTHAALRKVIQAEAILAPTIVIMEDLHWIDPASAEFLDYLIQTTGEMPILLILISREAERTTTLAPLIATLARHAERLTDIQLKALSEKDGLLLVDQLIAQAATGTVGLKKLIAKRAEGIPFYTEEIIRMLVAEGGLLKKEQGWQITSLANTLLERVPGTLQGLILARFDRSMELPRRVLQAAAAIGRSFPSGLIQSLFPSQSNQLESVFADLEERQFLVARPFGGFQGYAFRHVLIQEAVYSTLLRRDRRRFHERVANAIQESAYWPPAEKNEVLSYHYSQSTDPAKAIPFLMVAAEHADRRCANETAIRHYRKALELIEQDPAESRERQSIARIGLGRALKFVGELEKASQVLSDSLDMVTHSPVLMPPGTDVSIMVATLRELADVRAREGDYDQAFNHLETALDSLGPTDGTEWDELLWRSLIDRMAWIRFRQGALDEAYELASKAVKDVELDSVDDPTVVASIHNTLGGIYWQQGDWAAAARAVEQSLALYRNLGYTWGTANAYNNLGILYFRNGEWPKALANWEHTLTLRQTIGDIQNEAIALNNLGQCRMYMGQHRAAEQDLDRGLELSQQSGDSWILAQSLVNLAQLSIARADLPEASSRAGSALTLADALGSTEVAIQARWILALARADLVSLRAGLNQAQQALTLAGESGLLEQKADCQRILGIIYARGGDWELAQSRFQESLILCQQQRDPYRQALALLAMGQMKFRRAETEGSGDQEILALAGQDLREAALIFECLGAAHDLQLARSALAKIKERIGLQTGATSTDLDSTSVDDFHIPEGERRTAAILWLSFEAPSDTDVELLFEVRTVVSTLLRAIAQDAGGEVMQRQDDLAVVFGAPIAYEDDVERSVQAAMQMRQALGQEAEIELPLTVRIAITHGEVTAGWIRSQLRSEFVVTGRPVRDAQRLARTAPAEETLVSKDVRTLAHRLFEFEPALAGLADFAVFRLVGYQDEPAPARGIPSLGSRLIGRDYHLQAMTDLAINLERQIGGLIWIEGEPGIGKSRLMREVSDRIEIDPVWKWTGRCSPQRSGSPFSLFSDLLAQAFEIRLSDSPSQILAKVDQVSRSWSRDAQVARPYLEMLLGIQPRGQVGERIASLEPEHLRQQTFVAFRRLLRNLADERPLVIMLDDLQWIDAVSAEMLLFLLTMVATTPVLFICTQRRQGSDAPNDRLVRMQSLIPTQTMRVRLEQLSEAEAETLLRELLAGGELPNALISTILEQSEGNPYFIEEFVRMLIDRNWIQLLDDRWELQTVLDLDALQVPTSLETLIRSRIDALPAELKQLVQSAVVIGSPFEVDLLRETCGQPNIMMNLNRLHSRLIAHPRIEGEQWEFNHSLIETVTYNGLLRVQRRAYHQRVAEALEARGSAGGEIESAERLAYHFSRAGRDDRALPYLVIAGEQARARSANEDAIAHLEEAARQLAQVLPPNYELHGRVTAGLGDAYRDVGRLEDSIDILREGIAISNFLPPLQRVGLVRRLGHTAQKQGDLESSLKHLNRARTILGQVDSREERAEAARILLRLAWTYLLLGQLDDAEACGRESLEQADSAGALGDSAAAENLLGGIFYNRGNWTQAVYHTSRAMRLREEMDYSWGVASTLNNLGILEVLAGNWNQARAHFERSLAVREEVGDVEGVAISHRNLGALDRDRGALDPADLHFRQSLAVATPFKMGVHMASATLDLAEVLQLKGELDAASEVIAAGQKQVEALGAKDLRVQACRVEAEILLARVDLDGAKEMAERSATLAIETGNRPFEAIAWRVLAQIELHRGDIPAARHAIDNAYSAMVDVTDELGAGRIAAQAGAVYLAEGNRDEAEEQLRLAHDIFTRLGAAFDLAKVKESQTRLNDPLI